MKRWGWWAAGMLTVAAIPPLVPQVLAFPYRREIGPVTVWSETPIAPAIAMVIARADKSVAASPLSTATSGRHVFLTKGGWRWRWLTLVGWRGFGLTWPLSEAVLVNRSDIAADTVWNSVNIRRRTLSGVIAHERTHTLIRARLGLIAAAMLPLWLREGYPDYVARESSLSDADAAVARRADPADPALAYYDGRRRVAVALKANGGSVDRLFAEYAR